jgi:hypothetical protein
LKIAPGSAWHNALRAGCHSYLLRSRILQYLQPAVLGLPRAGFGQATTAIRTRAVHANTSGGISGVLLSDFGTVNWANDGPASPAPIGASDRAVHVFMGGLGMPGLWNNPARR